MFPSILLLDGPTSQIEKLKKLGFDISYGTVGFSTGIRNLPSQVYEKDVFIYNPISYFKDARGCYIDEDEIENKTTEFELDQIRNRIRRGGTLLVFLNQIAIDKDKQNEAYSWIPNMPAISFTKDQKIIVADFSNINYMNERHLVSLVNRSKIKLPVDLKIKMPTSQGYPADSVVLFANQNSEALGGLLRVDEGQIILLPQYISNEDLISVFVNRVLPKIYNLTSQSSIIDDFISPEETRLKMDISNIKDIISEQEDVLHTNIEAFEEAKRAKINTIKNDEAAVLILNYYNQAIQQEDMALFFLYKAIEHLEHKLGGEAQAKQALGNNTEWNFVNRMANESYRDGRHALKPGEKIKLWSSEDIKTCFEATRKIIDAYLATLF